MEIAILGTGRVAQTITPKLLAAGHQVVLGSRRPSKRRSDFARLGAIEIGTYDQAASSAGLIIDALPGTVALEVLGSIAPSVLEGKILMDVANAVVEREDGLALVLPNGSLGEELQKALPGVHVVKTLNTMSATVIEDPTALPAPSSVFVSGNTREAKRAVIGILQDLGWPENSIIDLGCIATARGPEHMFPLLAALFGALGTARLNVAVVR